VRGELAVELPSSTTPLARRSSAPAEVSAEFFAGVAPLTMKLAPGSVWTAAASDGSLIQSCAHATRAQGERGLGVEQQQAIEASAQFAARIGGVA
jgi:hypothetical protein